VVAAAAVADDLHPVEGQRDVGRVGREQLLARLAGQHGVPERQGRVPKGRRLLARDARDAVRQLEVHHLAQMLPRGKPARLAVVPVVGQAQLRPHLVPTEQTRSGPGANPGRGEPAGDRAMTTRAEQYKRSPNLLEYATIGETEYRAVGEGVR
jgi:hypothetical protein